MPGTLSVLKLLLIVLLLKLLTQANSGPYTLLGPACAAQHRSAIAPIAASRQAAPLWFDIGCEVFVAIMGLSLCAGVACSLSIRGAPRGSPVQRMRCTPLRRRCLLTVDPGRPSRVARATHALHPFA